MLKRSDGKYLLTKEIYEILKSGWAIPEDIRFEKFYDGDGPLFRCGRHWYVDEHYGIPVSLCSYDCSIEVARALVFKLIFEMKEIIDRDFKFLSQGDLPSESNQPCKIDD